MDIITEIPQFLCQPLLWVLKQFFYWFSKSLVSDIAPDTYASHSNLVPNIRAELANIDPIISPYIGFVNTWVPLAVA